MIGLGQLRAASECGWWTTFRAMGLCVESKFALWPENVTTGGLTKEGNRRKR